MIKSKPSIVLNRLVIVKDGVSVYDQVFHIGVNIIYSDGNSTGKTTILDAIFYVLGGDIEEWIVEAASCSYVTAEFSFNNNVYTLKREIGESRFPPIYFFEGTFESSLSDSLNWMKFAHKRSDERESFSQAIFRLIGFPEHKLSNFSNITIHEILRLVYSDQLTAVNRIFREQEYDNDEIRQTIGELLLGIDDLDLHGLRLELKTDEKNLSKLIGRISATEDVFLSVGLVPDIASIDSELERITGEINNIKHFIEQLEIKDIRKNNTDEVESIKSLQIELSTTKRSIQSLRDRKSELLIEIEDSNQFIESLKLRQESLTQSEATNESLGELKFEYCPSCLSPILSDTDESHCHLCKNNNVRENEVTGFLRMQFELNYQLRESEELLEIRNTEISTIDNDLAKLEMQRRSLQSSYNSYIDTSNPVAAEVKNAMKQLGMLEQKAESTLQKYQQIELLVELQNEKTELSGKIEKTAQKIETLEKLRANRVAQIASRIESITIDLLHKDIPSEETFASASEFSFDFRKNRLLVDGRSKFSASSVCYLKTAFLFSLFLLSIEDEQVLFPCFALHDNIEDKGATPHRVQNLHKIIIDSLKDVKTQHQFIFTTAVLSKEYEDSNYCVGPKYDYFNKTLKI